MIVIQWVQLAEVNVRWRKILFLIFVLVNVSVKKMSMEFVATVARKDSLIYNKTIFLVVNVSIEGSGTVGDGDGDVGDDDDDGGGSDSDGNGAAMMVMMVM